MHELWVDSSELAKRHGLVSLESQKKWVEVVVRKSADLAKITEAKKAGAKTVILKFEKWAVEKAELAKTCKGVAAIVSVKEAKDIEKATDSFGGLVRGFLLSPSSEAGIRSVMRVLKSEGKLALAQAKVVNKKSTGEGEVCVIDVCDELSPDDGILAGPSQELLLFVQSEASQPGEPVFRLKPGAITSDVLVPGGTKFASELKPGSKILIIEKNGHTRSSVIARVDIVRMPLVFIGLSHSNQSYSAVLENSPDVRLMTKSGAKSVVKLKNGDEVLVFDATRRKR